MIIELGCTIAVALAGSFIGKKLHMPAAFMTGAMIAVIFFSYFTDMAYCPTTAKPFVQLVAGAFIALGIDMQTVKDMKKIVKPLIAYICCLIVWALICGYIMFFAGNIDSVTAFLSCVPGGLTDISLISIDMGANTPQVTTLQTLRMIMAVGLFPVLTKLYVKRFGTYFKSTAGEKRADNKEKKKVVCTFKNLCITLAIAFIGGTIGSYIGFPSATLTGSMIAVAVYNIFTGNAFVPVKLRRVTQVVAGAMIGAMVTRADIQSLVYMVIPFCIIVCEYVVFDFVIAPVLAKIFHMELLTMILACTPAGASDMALIAGDMGGEISEVAVFHVVRLCIVLTVFPPAVGWISTVL